MVLVSQVLVLVLVLACPVLVNITEKNLINSTKLVNDLYLIAMIATIKIILTTKIIKTNIKHNRIQASSERTVPSLRRSRQNLNRTSSTVKTDFNVETDRASKQ